MFKTLYSRMLAAYLSVTFAVIALLGYVSGRIFTNYYMGAAEISLSREAYEINRIIYEEYLDEAKRAVAREKLFAVVRQFGGLVQLYFNDQALGKQNYYDYLSNGKWNVTVETDFFEISNGAEVKKSGDEEFYYDLFTDETKSGTLSLLRPIIKPDGEEIGTMVLHYDLSDVYIALRELYRDIFMAAAAALLIISAITVIITKRMTKPISHMTDVVHAITHGSYDARVVVTHDDELGKLGKSFNEMADKVAVLEQTRREFVANVSHELRSPLTSMRGFLEAMEEGVIPSDEQQKYIGIVLDETKRMSSIVNDLLDLARIESGKYSLEKTVFDVNELVSKVLLSFESRIREAEIDVNIALLETAALVEADSARIEQVLHNLIDNAIKFMPKQGGKLTVNVTADRQKYNISVGDNGPGIAKEDIQKIFDRFYKAEKAHTYYKGSGTGLGLSIVKRIIEQHDEDITVSSGNGGTVFTFTLKRASLANKRAQ